MGNLGGGILSKLLGNDGGTGFRNDFHDDHFTHLVLGVKHDGIINDFMAAWEPFLKRWRAEMIGMGGKEVDLWMLLKEAGGVSMCRAIWGPQSPLSVETGLWKDLWVFVEWYHPV